MQSCCSECNLVVANVGQGDVLLVKASECIETLLSHRVFVVRIRSLTAFTRTPTTRSWITSAPNVSHQSYPREGGGKGEMMMRRVEFIDCSFLGALSVYDLFSLFFDKLFCGFLGGGKFPFFFRNVYKIYVMLPPFCCSLQASTPQTPIADLRERL